MPHNTNHSHVSEEATPLSQSFWKRAEIAAYGLAALAECSVIAIALRVELSPGITLSTSLFAWWVILISFWCPPAFCWFKIERKWLSESHGKGVRLVALWSIYWPLLVSKKVYFWLLVHGVAAYYVAKYLYHIG